MRIVCLLVLVTISTPFLSQAQDRFIKAYYVSTRNDTVRGLIRYRDSYPRGLTFKTDLKAPGQDLSTNEVKSFTFENGQTYELVNFADKNAPSNLTYAKKLGGNSISLYQSHGQFLMGSEEKSFFVIKKGKASNSAEAMSRYQKNIGAFNVLFNDCPDVKEKAAKTAVSEELLLERLAEYHTCKSAPFKSYIPAGGRRLQFGVFTGVSIANLSLSGDEHLENASFNTSTKPHVGAMMTFTPGKKTSSIFSMQLELMYTSMFFQGTYNAQRSVGGYDITINSSTTVNSQIVMPRLGIRLTGRSNVLNPYLTFGIGAPISIKSESNDVNTVTINNGSETTETQDSIEIGNGAVWGGAGLRKNLAKDRALFVDVTLNLLSASEGGNVMMIMPRVGFMF